MTTDPETVECMQRGIAAAADVIGLPKCLDALCQGEVYAMADLLEAIANWAVGNSGDAFLLELIHAHRQL